MTCDTQINKKKERLTEKRNTFRQFDFDGQSNDRLTDVIMITHTDIQASS